MRSFVCNWLILLYYYLHIIELHRSGSVSSVYPKINMFVLFLFIVLSFTFVSSFSSPHSMQHWSLLFSNILLRSCLAFLPVTVFFFLGWTQIVCLVSVSLLSIWASDGQMKTDRKFGEEEEMVGGHHPFLFTKIKELNLHLHSHTHISISVSAFLCTQTCALSRMYTPTS